MNSEEMMFQALKEIQALMNEGRVMIMTKEGRPDTIKNLEMITKVFHSTVLYTAKEINDERE